MERRLLNEKILRQIMSKTKNPTKMIRGNITYILAEDLLRLRRETKEFIELIRNYIKDPSEERETCLIWDKIDKIEEMMR